MPRTTRFSDDFNRANEDPLTATNWQGGYTSGLTFVNLQAVSNQCQISVNKSYGLMTQKAYSLPNDHWVQFTVVNINPTIPGSTVNIQLVIRAADPPVETFYTIELSFDGTTWTTSLTKWITGTDTPVTSNSTSWAAADVCRVEVIGNAITVYKNDVSVLSTTDGSIATGSRTGAAIFIANVVGELQSDAIFDSFVTGDFITDVVGTPFFTTIGAKRI